MVVKVGPYGDSQFRSETTLHARPTANAVGPSYVPYKTGFHEAELAAVKEKRTRLPPSQQRLYQLFKRPECVCLQAVELPDGRDPTVVTLAPDDSFPNTCSQPVGRLRLSPVRSRSLRLPILVNPGIQGHGNTLGWF